MPSLDVDRAIALGGAAAAGALLALPEDQWFDRKSSRVQAKDLAVALVAFANAEGGAVVVGLHNGKVEGVSSSQENALRQAALDFTTPPVRASVTALSVPGNDVGETVLIFRVEPGEQVHTVKDGTAYLRVGDQSHKLNAAQHRELLFDRGNAPYEGTPVDLSVSDLDQDQLQSYTSAIGSSSIKAMLAARGLTDRQGRLTVAAELLFDAHPQRELPSAYVRVMRYGETERGTGATMSLEDGHDIRCEGSIPAQITAAARVIDELLPKWRQLRPDGRFEAIPRLPRDAWLEGVVNAVVHRSYSMMGDHIRVEIFPNRVEITSPGRFPGLANPTYPLEISRYARNPRIARVCADLGITRELGEGIKRMFEEMRRRGLVDPIYTQTSGAVHLILMASDAVPAEVLARLTRSTRAVLDEMRLAGRPLGTGHIADLAGVSRPTANRALSALADEGLVEWQGQSARDPRATWRLT